MHRIRLRRPWTLETADGEQQRVDAPDERRQTAAATYSRSFNLPTSINATTEVTLVIESWHAESATVLLNDASLVLDSNFPFRENITGRLRPVNRIDVKLTAGVDGRLALDGAVWLEILEH
ncbi:MAG: hypothetical protein AAFU85_06495 [Planctomycetota bacterium]